MRPAGRSEVDRAKADGRWDAAYDGQRSATVPDELQRALDKNRRGARVLRHARQPQPVRVASGGSRRPRSPRRVPTPRRAVREDARRGRGVLRPVTGRVYPGPRASTSGATDRARSASSVSTSRSRWMAPSSCSTSSSVERTAAGARARSRTPRSARSAVRKPAAGEADEHRRRSDGSGTALDEPGPLEPVEDLGHAAARPQHDLGELASATCGTASPTAAGRAAPSSR